MRGATYIGSIFTAGKDIPTHAPHAGSDWRYRMACWLSLYSNPRSPCGERHISLTGCTTKAEFQPTLPMRGATPHSRNIAPIPKYSNPRSPCGERHPIWDESKREWLFQPTLPMRGATLTHRKHSFLIIFQPTLPMRGATATYCVTHYMFTRYGQIS